MTLPAIKRTASLETGGVSTHAATRTDNIAVREVEINAKPRVTLTAMVNGEAAWPSS
jgi:hypothetical protein